MPEKLFGRPASPATTTPGGKFGYCVDCRPGRYSVSRFSISLIPLLTSRRSAGRDGQARGDAPGVHHVACRGSTTAASGRTRRPGRRCRSGPAGSRRSECANVAPRPPFDGLLSDVTLPLKFTPLLFSRAGLIVLKFPSWNSAPTLKLCELLIQVAEEPRVRFLTVKSVVQPLKRTAPSEPPHQSPIWMVGRIAGASGPRAAGRWRRGSGASCPASPRRARPSPASSSRRRGSR